MRAVKLVGAGLVAEEILGGEIVAVARQERAGVAPHPLRPPFNLGGNVVRNSSE